MASNEIFLLKQSFDDLFKEWKEKNPEAKHPQTTFIESLGLRYLQTTQTMGIRFIVEDPQKYFLAKIQYGI